MGSARSLRKRNRDTNDPTSDVMQPRTTHLALPDFDRPPVVEVAVGVQFEVLPLKAAHLGLLWQHYQDQFPRVEEQPPLEAIVERFGVKPAPARQRVRLLEEPLPLRFWFVNESGTELVQVQQDRFVFNWRQNDADQKYPRYETVAARFSSAFESFMAFLREHRCEEPKLNQCEVIYVNHILPVQGVWMSHGDAGKVITLLSTNARVSFLPEPEELKLAARFVIPGGADEESPIGRLHVTAEPRFFLSDGRPLIWLQLLARGVPLGDGVDGARRFFDLGREWIVRGFVEITTPDMHQAWGRR